MRREGTIVRWDERRGFGFIRSGDVGLEVFLHARDYRAPRGETPRTGLRVTFEHVHVGGKGPRAVSVRPHAAPPSTGRSQARPARQARRTTGSGAWWVLPLMLAYALALGWMVSAGRLPAWVPAASAALNVAAFLAYAYDKQAAQRGRWRVDEYKLHLWSLAGGWGGAWFAQRLLRHKSAKPSFRGAYRATVAAHCAGASCLWWFTRLA